MTLMATQEYRQHSESAARSTGWLYDWAAAAAGKTHSADARRLRGEQGSAYGGRRLLPRLHPPAGPAATTASTPAPPRRAHGQTAAERITQMTDGTLSVVLGPPAQ